MPDIFNQENGNVLSMTLVLIFACSAIAFSYIKIIQFKAKESRLKIVDTRLFYASRAGIEDAIYELKQSHSWTSTALTRWQQNTAKPNTFYKNFTSSSAGFKYPINISVTVTEPNNDDVFLFESQATLTDSNNQSFTKTIKATVTKAFTNIFYITDSSE